MQGAQIYLSLHVKIRRMSMPRVTLTLFLLLFPVILHASFPHDDVSKKSSKSSGSRSSQSKKGPSLKIMAKGKAAPEAMASFMITHNSGLDKSMLNKLVKTYVIESNREGVNYEVAFCQMCLETGFLKFEGSVSRFQNNFCGLGCVDAWSGGDWFSSMEEGVRAHVQHLKAYASLDPIRGPLVDPRFAHVKRGTVTSVSQLTGKWASDPAYGEKITDLINRLYGF